MYHRIKNMRLKAMAFFMAVVMSMFAFPSLDILKVLANQIYLNPPANTQYPTSIQNGGFEENPLSKGTVTGKSVQAAQANVPGWSTTAPEKKIEIWKTGFDPAYGTGPYSAQEKLYFAEINCESVATLYQDLSTNIGSLYMWSLWHGGRMGKDTMQVLIGDPAYLDLENEKGVVASKYAASEFNGNTLLTDGNIPNNGGTLWGQHYGYYTSEFSVTRFAMESLYAEPPDKNHPNGNLTMGNLVDNVRWIKVADSTIQYFKAGDSVPVNSSYYTMNTAAVSNWNDLNNKASATDFTFNVDLSGLPQSGGKFTTPGEYKIPVSVYDPGGAYVGLVISTVYVTDDDPLVFKYVDTKGTTLQLPASYIYKWGSAYDITRDLTPQYSPLVYNVSDPAVFNGIKYKCVSVSTETPAGVITDGGIPAAGTIENPITVMYVFDKLQWTLDVKYILNDSTGTVVETLPQQTLGDGDNYSKPGYNTGDIVSLNGVDYAYFGMQSGSDPVSGTMNGNKNIVYILSIAQTFDVKVNYVDKNYIALKPQEITKYKSGDPYSVSNPADPYEITASDGSIKKYKLVRTEGDPLNGTADGNKTITFVLEPLTQTLTVNYAIKNGAVIRTDNKTFDNGDPYSVSEPGSPFVNNGKTYTYTANDFAYGPDTAALSGTMDTDKEITFYLVPVTHKLTVEFVDKDGNPVPTMPKTETIYDDGQSYAVNDPGTEIIIDGEKYVITQAPGNDALTGNMDGDKYVKFILTRADYTLTVRYVDKDGNILINPTTVLPYPPQTTTLQSSDAYSVPVPDPAPDPNPALRKTFTFDGTDYIYDSSSGSPVNGIMDGDKIIYFIMLPAPHIPNLYVNYIDTYGKPLQSPLTDNTKNFSDPYDTGFFNPGDVKIFDGKNYAFVKMASGSDPTSGYMDKDFVIVTYVFEPVTQTLIVNYAIKNGAVISTETTHFNNGTPYSVSEPPSTCVFAGRTYNHTTGDFTYGADTNALSGIMDTDKEITFYLVPVTHKLTVEYVDGNGKVLLSNDTVLDEGSKYDVKAPNIGDEVTINGKKYIYKGLKNGSDPETGAMDKDKIVTLVLEEVQAVTYTLTVEYVDENGNILKKIDTRLNENAPYSEPVPNAGDTLTVNGKKYTYKEWKNDSDAPSGAMDKNKTVIFVFSEDKPVTHTLNVEYVDEAGNVISSLPPVTIDEGNPYSANPPSGELTINGKTYIYSGQTGSLSDPPSGVMDKDKKVIFVITLKPVTPAPIIYNVTVTYKDEYGNVLIAPSINSYYEGSSYNVSLSGNKMTVNGKNYEIIGTTPESDTASGIVNANKNIVFILREIVAVTQPPKFIPQPETETTAAPETQPPETTSEEPAAVEITTEPPATEAVTENITEAITKAEEYIIDIPTKPTEPTELILSMPEKVTEAATEPQTTLAPTTENDDEYLLHNGVPKGVLGMQDDEIPSAATASTQPKDNPNTGDTQGIQLIVALVLLLAAVIKITVEIKKRRRINVNIQR